MQAPLVAGIGELLWDKLPGGDRLGGATANFAVCSARLGEHTFLVSGIGDDADGRAALDLLSLPGLNLSLLQRSAAHPTGTVEVTFSSSSQPSYEIAGAVAWDFIAMSPELEALARSLAAVSFGTLAQRHEVSRATIQSFVRATPPPCVRVCDVNLRLPFCTPAVLAWSMEHATVIKLSDEELPTVFSLLQSAGVGVRNASADVSNAADLLLAHFPRCAMVAMTLGGKGSVLRTREARGGHAGFAIKVVDTVGAGDAFTAGMVHAYLRGAPLEVIAEVGNLCGSFVASQAGAMPPLSTNLLQQVGRLLADHRPPRPTP